MTFCLPLIFAMDSLMIMCPWLWFLFWSLAILICYNISWVKVSIWVYHKGYYWTPVLDYQPPHHLNGAPPNYHRTPTDTTKRKKSFHRCLLKFNRCLAPWIVLLQSISVLVVIVKSLVLLEDYPLPTNCTEFVFTHLIVYIIGEHKNNYTVLLFYIKYTKRHIFKLITQFIHNPSLLFN